MDSPKVGLPPGCRPAGGCTTPGQLAPMLEQRNLKLDLLALGLLALTIFLAASLLSYDPADPPSKLVYPATGRDANVCGRSGRLVSRLLFDGVRAGGLLPAVLAGRARRACC